MAPEKVIEKKYKESVGAEVAENISKKVIWEAIEEKKYIVVSEPQAYYDSIERGASFKFKAFIEVAPTVELGEYKGVKCEELLCEIDNKTVDNEIDNMRERYAEVKPIEDPNASVEKGKLVKFKVKRLDNIEDEESESSDFQEYSILIGKSDDKYSVDKYVLGMKKDEEKEISIKYPSDYYLKEFAGNTAKYHVIVLEINEMTLPEMDDEFAKKIGENSVDDLKKNTREYLEKVVKERVESNMKGVILGSIVEKSSFDIPRSMVLREMDTAFQKMKDRFGYKADSMEEFAQMVGQDPKEYEKILRMDAERAIKNTLILSEVARQENLTVPEEKYKEVIQGYADGTGKSFEEIEEIIEQNNSKSRIEDDLILDVSMDFLIANANVSKSKKMSFDEFLRSQKSW